MMAALEMCRNERDIRAIVVIGSGKTFCSGAESGNIETIWGTGYRLTGS